MSQSGTKMNTQLTPKDKNPKELLNLISMHTNPLSAALTACFQQSHPLLLSQPLSPAAAERSPGEPALRACQESDGLGSSRTTPRREEPRAWHPQPEQQLCSSVQKTNVSERHCRLIPGCVMPTVKTKAAKNSACAGTHAHRAS